VHFPSEVVLNETVYSLILVSRIVVLHGKINNEGFDFASLLIQWLTVCYFPCHPPCICWGWKQDNWTTYSLFLDCFDQYLLFVPQKTRTLFVILGRSEVQTLFILPKVSSPSPYFLFSFLNNQFFDKKIFIELLSHCCGHFV